MKTGTLHYQGYRGSTRSLLLKHLSLLLIVLMLSSCDGYFSDKGENASQVSGTSQLDYTCRIRGKVVKVVDGDTAYVLDDQQVQHKIRFAGIDAPERSQAFGKKAKQYVSRMIFGKHVCVDYRKTDRWGRLIGSIIIDGQLVNLEVVRTGLAWHYKAYQDEQSAAERLLFARVEIQARRAKKGLWADARAIPPWSYRKR